VYPAITGPGAGFVAISFRELSSRYIVLVFELVPIAITTESPTKVVFILMSGIPKGAEAVYLTPDTVPEAVS
jgi:hypothetical protein